MKPDEPIARPAFLLTTSAISKSAKWLIIAGEGQAALRLAHSSGEGVMFVAALIGAGVQLVVASLCFTPSREIGTVGRFAAAICGGFAVLVCMCGVASLVLLVQAIALVLLGIVQSRYGSSRRCFVLCGGIVTVAVFAVVFAWTLGTFHRARERYPFISLADRLSYEPNTEVLPQITSINATPAPTANRLRGVGRYLRWQLPGSTTNSRPTASSQFAGRTVHCQPRLWCRAWTRAADFMVAY